MFLFLNTIVKPADILLFSKGRIFDSESFDISGREHDELLEHIESFLTANGVILGDIQNTHHEDLEINLGGQSILEGIVVVCGPGGFTSTRIVSLIVNTWRSLYAVSTQSMTLFEVFEKSGGQYPMCVKANRGEYLIQETRESDAKILPISAVLEKNYTGIGDISDFENRKISIQSGINYKRLIQNFSFTSKDENIEPYYIKKPNIT